MIEPRFEKFFNEDVLLLRKERLGREDAPLPDPRRVVLSLYMDKVLLGYVSSYERGPESYLIEEIVTRKELEKKKIAYNSLLFLEVRIRERGGRRLFAEVPLSYRPFFEKLGFRAYQDGELIEKGGDYLLPMEKWLVNPFRKRKAPRRDGRL